MTAVSIDAVNEMLDHFVAEFAAQFKPGVGNSQESSYTLVRPGQNLPISPLIEFFGISRISLESRIFVHPSCELPTPGLSIVLKDGTNRLSFQQLKWQKK